MSETLFTSQTPSVDGTDGSPGITTATTIKFATAGTIDAVRFYATATPGGTYTVCVWQVTNSDAGFGGTGTLLASKAVSSAGITGHAFNTVTLDTPVSVDTTHLYRVGVHNANLYVATNSFFASALTNGNLTAPANNSDPLSNGWTLWQGTFIINASPTYPTSVGSSASYFVDPVFTATGSGTTQNATAAQTATLAGTATGAGIHPADGAQTASLAGTAAATGLHPTDAAQTATLAGAAAATGVHQADGAQTVTLAGTAAATVTRPGLSADAAQTVGFAGVAAGVVIHNAQASQAISLAGTVIPEPSPEPVIPEGSWAGLLDALVQARADHEVAERRRRAPRECPVHGWPLEVVRGIRHCKFGGHVVRTW